MKFIFTILFCSILYYGYSQDKVTTSDVNGILKKNIPIDFLEARYSIGTIAPTDIKLIWKNPNISVVVGETTDYTYQQGIWRPVKPLTLYDFGAKPFPANSYFAIQKALNWGGVVIVPDTIFTALSPLTVYSNTTLKGGTRDKSWIAANFYVGDSTVQNTNITFQDVSIGLPSINGWSNANRYAISVRNVFNFNYLNGFVKGCNGGGIEFKDKGFISTNYKIVNVDFSFNFKGEILYNAPSIVPTGTNYFTDIVFVNCKVNTGAYNFPAIVVDVNGALNFTASFTNVYVDFLNRNGICLKQNAIIKGDNLTLDNTGNTEGITLAYTPTTNVNKIYSNIVKGMISLPVGIYIIPTNTSISNNFTNNFAGTPFIDKAVSNGVYYTNTDDLTVQGNVTDFSRYIYGTVSGMQYQGAEHRFNNMVRANTDYIGFRIKNNTGGLTTDFATRIDGTTDIITSGTKLLNVDGQLKIDAKLFGGKPINISGLEEGNNSDSLVSINPVTGDLRRIAISSLPSQNEFNATVTITTIGGSVNVGLLARKTVNFFIHWTAANPTGGTITLPSTGNNTGDAINIYFRGDNTPYTNLAFNGGTTDGVIPTIFNKSNWLRFTWDGTVWLIVKT